MHCPFVDVRQIKATHTTGGTGVAWSMRFRLDLVLPRVDNVLGAAHTHPFAAVAPVALDCGRRVPRDAAALAAAFLGIGVNGMPDEVGPRAAAAEVLAFK